MESKIKSSEKNLLEGKGMERNGKREERNGGEGVEEIGWNKENIWRVKYNVSEKNLQKRKRMAREGKGEESEGGEGK